LQIQTRRKFIIDSNLKNNYKIHLVYFEIFNLNNSIKNYSLKRISNELILKIKNLYKLENLIEDPIIKAYRQFYWSKLKIDPTKIRPSGEALIRRILQGKELPVIILFVDIYNLASAFTKIPIGAYDSDKINGNIILRKAKNGDKFIAIGNKEIILNGNELITIDEKGTILSQFPYRDAENTKISENSKNIFIACYGIEGIIKEELFNAANLIIEFLKSSIFSDINTTSKPEYGFNISEFFYESNF